MIYTKRLTDAAFAEANARFGEQGVVELGSIIGYYTAIGNALNAFQVSLPAVAPQPFPEYSANAAKSGIGIRWAGIGGFDRDLA